MALGGGSGLTWSRVSRTFNLMSTETRENSFNRDHSERGENEGLLTTQSPLSHYMQVLSQDGIITVS